MRSIPDEIKFARAEVDRIFVDDDKLSALYYKNTHLFLPDGPTAALPICERIGTSIQRRQALSLVRVGDGEGNALGMTKTPLHGLQISAFNQKFISQNGVGIPLDEAVNFCRSLRDALRSADIVGFRSFRFDEKAMIFNHLNEGRPNAALGFLYAREFLQQGLFESWWKATVVTSAWIHLDVISHLGRIFDAAESIIFITGRAELRDEVRSRLGAKLEAFIAVPTQGYKPPLPKQSHFYSAFPAVLEQLDKDLRGKLVLVGAGLFGKIYCHAAKRNGAVAVDIGSAFDVLAGFTTRPIHRHYNVQGLRWT